MWFGIGKKSWTMDEILNTFIDTANKICINEINGKMIIEIEIDNLVRIFEESKYGYNKFFYEVAQKCLNQ